MFFKRREIEVYPDSYPSKPPVGKDLNKKAEITLEKVWPNDKTLHKPITVRKIQFCTFSFSQNCFAWKCDMLSESLVTHLFCPLSYFWLKINEKFLAVCLEQSLCSFLFVLFLQSPERLKLQGWQKRVEAATAKLGATFLDYDPDNGNWVFTVS